MAWVATNNKAALGITEDIPVVLRARMFEALAPYLNPKLKSTEIPHVGSSERETYPSLPATKALLETFLANELPAPGPEVDKRFLGRVKS